MGRTRIEWDPRKAKANQSKHGVSFEEASTVFYDDDALFMRESEDCDGEDRYVLLGLSSRLRALVVCHCYRDSEGVIRIISARKANRSESRDYERRRAR
jgi:uncharacterized protein